MSEPNTTTFSKPGSESCILGASTRFWLAFFCVYTVCLMAIWGLKVEEPLYTIAVSAVSFYFGNARQKTAT